MLVQAREAEAAQAEAAAEAEAARLAAESTAAEQAEAARADRAAEAARQAAFDAEEAAELRLDLEDVKIMMKQQTQTMLDEIELLRGRSAPQ